MKKIIVIAIISLVTLSCSGPNIQFQSTKIDMGKIKRQHKYSVTFKFKNSGGSELYIKKVQGT